MTPLRVRGALSAVCLVNWDTSMPIVDDGSYENWLEGTRILEAAISSLPIDVTHILTGVDNTNGMRPRQAIEMLRTTKVRRVFVAGNFIERDVLPFATELVEFAIEPTVLFDVCGTLDPMEKWRSLAAAVDRGAKVSTVQQSLGHLAREIDDPKLGQSLASILFAGLGEHAVELSAA